MKIKEKHAEFLLDLLLNTWRTFFHLIMNTFPPFTGLHNTSLDGLKIT